MPSKSKTQKKETSSKKNIQKYETKGFLGVQLDETFEIFRKSLRPAVLATGCRTWVDRVISCGVFLGVTLPETNIFAPENRPLEKEIPIGNHHF